MSKCPLISIIMPAYNAAHLISQTLDSILAQTYNNWELIIVDDLSIDGTSTIINQFQARDPRIHYHCVTEHQGKPSIIRNIGLTLAKGQFITFTDADDICYPDGLEVLVKPLLAEPELHATIAFPLVCDSELNPIEYSPYLVQDNTGKYRLSSNLQFDWEKLCREEVNFSLCCTMFKKAVIERLGPLDEALITGEDYKYIVSLLLLGFQSVKFVPAYTFKYRTYLGSTTKSPEKIIRHIDCYVRVSNWLFSLPAMPNYYRKYQGEHLAMMLSCLLASLSNMNRKDLTLIGLIKCSRISKIPLLCKLKYFGKESLRVAVPSSIQKALRSLLNKEATNYFSRLKLNKSDVSTN